MTQKTVPLLVRLVRGFERHLQDSVSHAVSVQAGDGHCGLLVICHGNKPKPFAFVGVKVTDDLDVGNSTERTEHLPQDAFIGILTQVVDEETPSRGRAARHVHPRGTAHVVNTHGWKPARERSISQSHLQTRQKSSSMLPADYLPWKQFILTEHFHYTALVTSCHVALARFKEFKSSKQSFFSKIDTFSVHLIFPTWHPCANDLSALQKKCWWAENIDIETEILRSNK